MRTYLNTTEESTKIKIILSYNLGNSYMKRGYYLYAYPIREELTNGVMFEFMGLHTGNRMLILECKKKSEKAYNEAINIANTLQNELIENVTNKNNLTLLNS